MSQESNGGGCGWFGFFLWVFPWFWAGEKDGISGGEVGLILLWYGFLLLITWLAVVARSR